MYYARVGNGSLCMCVGRCCFYTRFGASVRVLYCCRSSLSTITSHLSGVLRVDNREHLACLFVCVGWFAKRGEVRLCLLLGRDGVTPLPFLTNILPRACCGMWFEDIG